jgi:tetratricopeptide (TPR) repeat protein
VAGDLGAAEELIESCARLPLALSISAARAAIRPGVSLAALAAELRDAMTRLDHLEGGDATSSVRAVFSWSCAQLGPAATRMFRLLGLHPGPDISCPAAASMAGMPVREARAALDELMLSSLVTEDRAGRYSLHDLLRVYAAEQAVAGDSEADRRAAVHRMLDHYLFSAYGAALLWAPLRAPLTLAAVQPGVTPERLASYGDAQTWCETEYQVLMGALAVAEVNGFDAHTWQITWCLTDFFAERARADEWQAAGLAALAGAAHANDSLGQARARHGLGNACSGLGRYEDACAHYAAALDLYDEFGDVVGQATVHLDLGLAYELTERHRDVFGVVSAQPSRAQAALGHARQALALFRAAGDRANEAMACSSVGRSLALNGQPGEAVGYCERSFRMHHELGNAKGEAVAMASLAYALHKSGEYADAIKACQRGLALCRQSGSLRLEAVTLTHLGEANRAEGNLRDARTAWEQALIILDDLNHPDADQVRARLHGSRQTQ